MTKDNSDKVSKPLIYVDKVKITEQEANMQRKFTTKKREELGERQEHKEEQVAEEQKNTKMEKIKKEFGVYEAMKEIETELDSIKKITNQYAPKPAPVEKEESPEAVKEEAPKKKRKRKKTEDKESSRDLILRLVRSDDNSKPLCEAVVFGETIQFQVLGMRGDSVKIKRGNHLRFIDISDIIDAKLVRNNGAN